MKSKSSKVRLVDSSNVEPRGLKEIWRAFFREFVRSFVVIWVYGRTFLKECWNKVARFYLGRIQSGKLVLIPSAMPRRFGLLIEALFWRCFRDSEAQAAEFNRIRDYASRGHLVYVMYCRSMFDYIFFNQFFLHHGLPLAQFANGIDLKFLMPFWKTFDFLLGRFVYRKKMGALPGPLVSSPSPDHSFCDLVRNRKPALIFLTREKSVFSNTLGFSEDPVRKLIDLQAGLKAPIFLVPQLVIWKKGPGSLRERTLFDDIFGNPDKPSPLRKSIHFLHYYRQAQVKFGQALDLQEFLKKKDKAHNPEEQARQVRWLLRHYLYRERKAVGGAQERPRAHIMNRILRHQEIKVAVEKWAAHTSQSPEEGVRLARKYAEEIVPDRRYAVLVIMAKVLHYVWKTLFDGLIVDEKQIEQVRSVSKDHPVVFVPNHRSHIDYLVVNCVIVDQHLVMPFICAGINLNFWPLGPLFRRAGAYFIRRSYPDPDLYPAVLNRYLREIMGQGSAQMFFIEGGRSRTGKLLQPKLGILAKIVEAFQAGIAKDVTFIPVSVGYDRILEEKSFLEEATGGERPSRKSPGGFFRGSRRFIRTRYGKIYVHFGEPISLAKYVRENDTPNVVERFAGRICFGINRVSVVYPTALVALVLLSHRKRSLSRVEIGQRTQPLIRYLEHRKVRFSDVFFNREYAIELALQQLLNANIVQDFREEDFVFYGVAENKRLLLNYYKNNVIHFFVTYSLLATTLLACARKKGEEGDLDFAEIESGYDFLRGLLDREFFFRPKEARSAYIRDVLAFFSREGDLTMANDQIRLTPNGVKNLKNDREIAYHYLESYGLLLNVLNRSKGRLIEEREFLKEVWAFGKRFYAQGRMERIESLSQFTLQNGLHFFAEKGFLMQESPRKGRKKNVWRVTDQEQVFRAWLEPFHEWTHQEIDE